MNDRELLELAAKAGGYVLTDGSQGYRTFRCKGGVEWNPLTDDGDALRLAVRLDIHLSLYGPQTGMNAWVVRDTAESFDEDYGDDPCASARRAIVRAAAEIGRSMP